MADKPHAATVYRADLLWGFNAIADEQHSRLAAFLGFEEDQPPRPKAEQKLPRELSEPDTEIVLSPAPAGNPPAKSQTLSYYRIVDRQINAENNATAEDKLALPDWFIEAKPTYFAETQTRIPQLHRIQPEYPPLVPWPRLWPLLQRVLGADVPGTKPDLNKLVKQVSQGEQIYRIPKTTRYTWSPTARLLIDINDSNFPYRQDFIRLEQQLTAWRGAEGLEIHYIYDEPGGTIARYDSGHENLEPWRSPALDTPLLIVSDLGMHSQSRRSLYQWLVFGQKLNLQGLRATVLMPVAERQLDKRLLRYFNCIIWDDNSRLKPVQGDEQPEQNPTDHTIRLEHLLALLFPALRVELGLLRSIRQLLPARLYDVGHEVDVWSHAAVNRAGDEWGWQAASREQYQQEFVEQFEELSIDDQQQLIEQLGRYHARLPDELYFEAMYELICLDVPVPEQVKTATLDFMSMLVKTYQVHPEHQGMELWVKRYLSRHDHPALRNEHQMAFMAIERQRRHQRDQLPIEWPEDIDLKKVLPFMDQRGTQLFYFLRQKGIELELISERQAQIQKNDWGNQAVKLLRLIALTNNLILRHPDINDRQQQFTINLETDLPYRFTLTLGKHQLEIGEESFTVEVQSAGDKPDWIHSQGMGSDEQFIETCSREGTIYRWYWHSPEIGGQFTNESLNSSNAFKPDKGYTCPGFWYYLSPDDSAGLTPDWADTVIRDQYGLCADVKIAGVMQRFRWIPPGSFMMGSPEQEKGRYGGETSHQVNLSQGYWLADTACTQALWQAVMHNNPSHFKGENRPVDSVSWNGVQQFLRTLNQQQTRLNLRLPSEAEWEYACRAGTSDSFNFEGELSLARVNYRGTWDDYQKWGEGALEQTAEVKKYPANAWGLYEMHGNVLEWCQDCYGDYPVESITDPTEPDTGADRVLRGGSWFDYGRYCRSAARYYYSPDYARDDFGFRLARGHQSGQTRSGAGQQPDGTHAAVARGTQPGDGLLDAEATQQETKINSNKTKSMIDRVKNLLKK